MLHIKCAQHPHKTKQFNPPTNNCIICGQREIQLRPTLLPSIARYCPRVGERLPNILDHRQKCHQSHLFFPLAPVLHRKSLRRRRENQKRTPTAQDETFGACERLCETGVFLRPSARSAPTGTTSPGVTSPYAPVTAGRGYAVCWLWKSRSASRTASFSVVLVVGMNPYLVPVFCDLVGSCG